MNLIVIGVFLQMCIDTRKTLKDYEESQGPNCKTANIISFLRPAMDGGQGGTGRRRRR
jgi:hypothetical protein